MEAQVLYSLSIKDFFEKHLAPQLSVKQKRERRDLMLHSVVGETYFLYFRSLQKLFVAIAKLDNTKKTLDFVRIHTYKEKYAYLRNTWRQEGITFYAVM